MEDFQINEYLPLRDVVFETLRQKILKGECERAKAAISIHIDNQEENILKNL